MVHDSRSAQAQTLLLDTTLQVNANDFSQNGCIRDFSASRCPDLMGQSQFTFQGTTYRVRSLYLDDDTGRDNTLKLFLWGTDSSALSPAPLRQYSLLLDGREFKLANGAIQAGTGQISWAHSGLTWVGGETVRVRLVRPHVTVIATPACGSEVTDTSVTPETRQQFIPAPASVEEVEYRVLAGTNGVWRDSLPIETHGFSVMTSTNTFDGLREAFPGFRGFEYRLKATPAVTATCTWSFPRSSTQPETTSQPDRPQTFPSLQRLPVQDSVPRLPRPAHAPYCYLAEGHTGSLGTTSEYVRYPDGTIRETTRASTIIRSLYACK